MRVKEQRRYRIRRACGAMETRQTTNLKIAGSTPARLVFLIKVIRSKGRSKREGGQQHVCTSGTVISVWHREYEHSDIMTDGYGKNKILQKVDYLTFPSV